jgi:site-specific DNA recombinase
MKNSNRVAVGYIRVSTFKQQVTGLSLEHQREKLLAWASLNDLVLETIYNDADESAKTGTLLERPGMRAIIERIEKHKISHVVAYKLDRLTRSVRDLDELIRLVEKREVSLVSVTESLDTSTATGRMVVTIIGIFAQWEREQIGERTKAALSVKRSRGEKLGGEVPFGFNVDGKLLVPHPREAPILESIVAMRNAGAGYTKIADKLNAEGTKPRTGKKWYPSSIRSICLRIKRQ